VRAPDQLKTVELSGPFLLEHRVANALTGVAVQDADVEVVDEHGDE
jgi:hypothetical protein